MSVLNLGMIKYLLKVEIRKKVKTHINCKLLHVSHSPIWDKEKAWVSTSIPHYLEQVLLYLLARESCFHGLTSKT